VKNRVVGLLAWIGVAGCAYTPTWRAAWTPDSAKEAIRLCHLRIADERMAPVRARGYGPTFTADDVAVTDQGFTTHGLEASNRGEPYLGGLHRVAYASIESVRIVPYTCGTWLLTLSTAGLVGPHWGKRLKVTFHDDDRVLYPATVRNSPDWWKNLFPLWPFFPKGPKRSEAHRLGAAIHYMAQQARQP